MAAQEHAAPTQREQQRRSERAASLWFRADSCLVLDQMSHSHHANTANHVIDKQQVSWNKRSPDPVTTGLNTGWCLWAAFQFFRRPRLESEGEMMEWVDENKFCCVVGGRSSAGPGPS